MRIARINMRKSLSILLLAITCNAASIAYGQNENRASRTWEVQKYDLSVTVPASEADRAIPVKAILNLRNASAGVASSLTLRISSKAEISGIKIGSAIGDFSKSEEKVGSGSLQRLSLRGVSVAPGGTLSVEVDYRLKVEENSGVASLTPVAAQMLPTSFWYPTPNSWYFPRGADFAPYRIQVTGPNGLNAISSGAMTGNSFDQGLLGQPFFVIGSFESFVSKNVTVALARGASAEEKKRGEDLAAFAADAKTFFEGMFGSSPAASLKLISVRRGGGFADTGTILVDENVFRRQKLDSLTAMSIAESVVRLWLGSTASITGDGGGAIREGLVRYFATEFIESKFGKEIADVERLRQRTAYASVAKRDAPMSQITPLDDYYFVTNANKGAMAWRLLSRRVGAEAFLAVLKTNIRTGSLDLSGMRAAFGQNKDMLDYLFDQVTDVDLMIGLPQFGNGESRMALRNTGSIDVQVDVVAIGEKGERLRNSVTVPARGFSETVFRSASKIVRAEIDSDKIYPQLDYSNDVKPVEIDESDLLLYVKRPFDRQDFVAAEKNGRIGVRDFPRFDDVRVLFGRALLALGRLPEAEKEFRAAIDERLPTARTLAWANVGLGEIALRNGQNTAAIQFFDAALKSNAEVGASIAARQGRIKANAAPNADDSIKSFFAAFDKAAVSSNKSLLESMLLSGETPKAFAGGIAGQAQEWTSRVTQVEAVDPQNVIVEVALVIRVINKEAESGTAVFRLTRIGGGWKLSGVESFEVR